MSHRIVHHIDSAIKDRTVPAILYISRSPNTYTPTIYPRLQTIHDTAAIQNPLAKHHSQNAKQTKTTQIEEGYTVVSSPPLHNLKNPTHHESRRLHTRLPLPTNPQPRGRAMPIRTRTGIPIQGDVHHVHRPRFHEIQSLPLNRVPVAAGPFLGQRQIHGGGAAAQDHH